MNSEASNKELLKNVVDFLVKYWLEHNEHFPNTSWSTTLLVQGYQIKDPRELYYDWVDTYPEFFTWVSILANRGLNLRGIYHSVNRIIEAKQAEAYQNAINVVQEELRYPSSVWEHEQWLAEYEKLNEFAI